MKWCTIQLLVLGILLLIVHIKSETCHTQFTDIQSSSLRAEVVFEGSVTEKLPVDPVSDRYNITVKVRKIHKGKLLLSENSKKLRKIVIGDFSRREDKSECVSDITTAIKKYIFFVQRISVSEKYYRVTAIPVKQGRKTSRSVRKILCKNCAKIPKIRPISNQNKTVDDSLKLKCAAKAKPRAVFSWFKDGVKLHNGQIKGLKIKSGKKGARLQIKKLKESDAGQYVCVAENAAGRQEKTVRVHVKPKVPQKIGCGPKFENYCHNGGTCYIMTELYNKKVCQCPQETEGERCESFDITMFTRENSTQAKLLHDRTLIIIGIVIAVLVFIIICVASYFLSRRQRKKWEKRKLMKSKRNIPDSSVPLLDDVDSAARPLRPPPTQLLVPRPTVDKGNQAGESFVNVFSTNEIKVENPPPSYTVAESIPFNHFLPSSKNRAARGSRSRLKAVSVDEPYGGQPESSKYKGPPVRSRSEPQPGRRDPGSREVSIIEMDPDSTESMQKPLSYSRLVEKDAQNDEVDYPAEKYTPPSPGTPNSDAPGVLHVQDVTNFPDEVPSPLNDMAANPLIPYLSSSDSDSEGEHSPLPVLYISEEDVRTSLDDLQSLEIDSGNANDTLSDPGYSPPEKGDLPNGTDSDIPSPISNGSTNSSAASVRSPSYIMYNSYQDTLNSTRSWDEQGTPVSDHFSYNSVPDSNVIEDQYMHKVPISPSKADHKNAVNKKLKDICEDQDAIPI